MYIYIYISKLRIYLRLHLSVALNISYSLLSAAELRDGITKQPSTYV